MSFPLVVVNTLSIFAGAMILACWLITLIHVHHAKMKTIVRVPLTAGVIAAALQLASDEPSWTAALARLVLVALATNFLMAYLFGFARWKRFDEDDLRQGQGRFAPVLIVWNAALAYELVVALVNLWLTETPIPFVGAV